MIELEKKGKRTDCFQAEDYCGSKNKFLSMDFFINTFSLFHYNAKYSVVQRSGVQN